MPIPKVNMPDFLGGLNELKAAAQALRDAVEIIADNRKRLCELEQDREAIMRQLESLEKRYSELLYAVGENRRGR